MVARQAHNLEVVVFKSYLRNQTKTTDPHGSFSLVGGGLYDHPGYNIIRHSVQRYILNPLKG